MKVQAAPRGLAVDRGTGRSVPAPGHFNVQEGERTLTFGLLGKTDAGMELVELIQKMVGRIRRGKQRRYRLRSGKIDFFLH